jgi:hypothetical protein
MINWTHTVNIADLLDEGSDLTNQQRAQGLHDRLKKVHDALPADTYRLSDLDTALYELDGLAFEADTVDDDEFREEFNQILENVYDFGDTDNTLALQGW